jgi:hypothetical protein
MVVCGADFVMEVVALFLIMLFEVFVATFFLFFIF